MMGRLEHYRCLDASPDCEAIAVSASLMLVSDPDEVFTIDRGWFARHYREAGERRVLHERNWRQDGRRKQDHTRAAIRNEHWPVEVGR